MKRLVILLSLPISLLACRQPAVETPFVCGSGAQYVCPAGTHCDSSAAPEGQGVCRISTENRCSVPRDCAPGFDCRIDDGESTGACVASAPCHSAAQCRHGEICVDWLARGDQGWARLSTGYCAAASSQTDTIACDERSHCPAPLACLGGSCGLECGVASDCPRGLSCLGQPGGEGLCLAIR